MSDTSDKFNRSVALEKAINFVGREADSDEVIKVAEKFRAFLAGDGVKPEKYTITVDMRPLLKLPCAGDGFLYFKFDHAPVLYRSNLAYMSDSTGGVQRLDLVRGTEWSKALSARLSTRNKLVRAPGYSTIPAGEAAALIRKNITGARFE